MSRMLKALGIGVLLTMSAAAAVKIEKVNFKGWPNSYRMTNGEVELVVTGDIGPRIIRYAFVGGRNVFKEYPDQIGKSGESTWQNRGGHRLWVAPVHALFRRAVLVGLRLRVLWRRRGRDSDRGGERHPGEHG